MHIKILSVLTEWTRYIETEDLILSWPAMFLQRVNRRELAAMATRICVMAVINLTLTKLIICMYMYTPYYLEYTHLGLIQFSNVGFRRKIRKMHIPRI
jgi:hypothetical protein